MPSKIDITGLRSGRLVVLGPAANKGRRTMWRCRCDCGNERDFTTDTITKNPSMMSGKGGARSCGCLKIEILVGNAKTHGHTPKGERSATYSSWLGIRARCLSPKAQYYDRYGGRGIKVCDRWRTFENFLADMGEKPAGLSIDRIDNDGNYEPGNCRWATPVEQTRNSTRVKLSVDLARDVHRRISAGESKKSVAVSLGVAGHTVYAVVKGITWRDVFAEFNP